MEAKVCRALPIPCLHTILYLAKNTNRDALFSRSNFFIKHNICCCTVNTIITHFSFCSIVTPKPTSGFYLALWTWLFEIKSSKQVMYLCGPLSSKLPDLRATIMNMSLIILPLMPMHILLSIFQRGYMMKLYNILIRTSIIT